MFTNDLLFRYRSTLDMILLSSGEELVDALKTFIEASTLFLFYWYLERIEKYWEWL